MFWNALNIIEHLPTSQNSSWLSFNFLYTSLHCWDGVKSWCLGRRDQRLRDGPVKHWYRPGLCSTSRFFKWQMGRAHDLPWLLVFHAWRCLRSFEVTMACHGYPWLMDRDRMDTALKYFGHCVEHCADLSWYRDFLIFFKQVSWCIRM